MKRLLAFLIALFVFDAAVLVATCRGDEAAGTGEGVRIGLVFDVGGRGDKSFNDQAWVGLQKARAELGVDVEYVEPGEGADRESAIRMLAAGDFDLVITTGFIFTDDVTGVAKEYPERRFACVDYAVGTDADGNPIPPPPNLAALKFREEQGSFLVGAVAGLTTQTRKVGFVGGMDIPLIRKFEAGYAAGVHEVCPDCEVSVNYAGVTSAAFKDPGKGKELALSQYRSGVDVIFHASGSTGLGVFEAARATDRLAIGVDADQHDEAPGYVLTSMVKRVDVAVYRIIEEVANGTFQPGIRVFGLAEGGVAYVREAKNAELLPASIGERVDALRDRVIAGEIEVPTAPGQADAVEEAGDGG